MPSWGLGKSLKMPREPTFKTLAGSAYIFERDGWATGHKHKSSQPPTGQAKITLAGLSLFRVAMPSWGLIDEGDLGGTFINGAGFAYIFERAATGNWTQAQKLTASDRAARDQFGKSVSISGDYAIVGANQEDEDASGANTQPFAGFCLYLLS